jgi:hypothetical protein
MPPKDKYSNPKLRDKVKEEIHQSDKGGAPGQWSARKAQMMAQEYKRRGGDYNTDKSEQDESQKNLSKWGEEEWQTKDGSAHAKKEDGTQQRYLPKKAWENMTEEEKEKTDEKKQEESKEGKQHVGNTEKAKESRRKANEEYEKYERKKSEEKKGKKNGAKKDEDENDEDDDEEHDEEEEGEEEYFEDEEETEPEEEATEPDDDEDEQDDEADDNDVEPTKPGQKRKSNSKQQSNGTSTSKKKQKSSGGDSGNAPKGKVGSKHMDATEPGPRGSADRLPKKGQSITWKAMPGYVDGEVTEVLTSGKKVDGKDVKASKQDPRIVTKSNNSGKICVHKPEACFYEDE